MTGLEATSIKSSITGGRACIGMARRALEQGRSEPYEGNSVGTRSSEWMAEVVHERVWWRWRGVMHEDVGGGATTMCEDAGRG
jgi:hypothetical protein